MRDVAEALGLSIMTVSRALRNAPGVAARTRETVLAAAKKLEYRPDPALAVLNAYRTRRRIGRGKELVAYVTDFGSAAEWQRIGTFARYFEGAMQRAESLGYRLQHFTAGEPDVSSHRFSQILQGRGIQGVLVGPLRTGQSSLALDWDLFSAVAIGRSLASPCLTTVCTNHFHAVELAWRTAHARGYRRIGLVLGKGEDARTMGSLRASFHLQQQTAELEAVPALVTPGPSPATVARWVKDHRIELMLSGEQLHYDSLNAALKRRVDFFHLNVDPTSPAAGIDQGHNEVGAHAVALLHLKLLQRAKGLPEPRDISLIDGTWHDGSVKPPPQTPVQFLA